MFDEAEADFSSAVALEPDNAFRYRERALFYLKDNNYEAALTDIQNAIIIDQSVAWPYLMRADMHMSQGNVDLAIADLTKVLNVEPQGVSRNSALQRLRLLGVPEIPEFIFSDPTSSN